jgi:hypothetical protein
MGDLVTDAIDAGSGPGVIEIRTGSRPATPETAVTGTLLATVTLGDPAFGTWASGASTIADPASVVAVADGTAGYCRVKDSNGNTVMDGTVTVTGGGGDLTLGSVSITTGQNVDVTGGSLTVPNP